MLELVNRYSDVISAITNVLFLLVWGVYLQLFLLEFRRERRPRVILHQTGEMDLDSVCMLSNMSREPVNIVLVTAAILRQDGSTEHQQLTERRKDPNLEHLKDETNQGPLASGRYFGLIRFRSLFEHMEGNGRGRTAAEDVRSVEIRVVFTYGPGARLNGACRRFRVSRSEDGRTRIVPEFLGTDQLRGHRERKVMARWLEASVPSD